MSARKTPQPTALVATGDTATPVAAAALALTALATGGLALARRRTKR